MQNATKLEAEVLNTMYFENKVNSFNMKYLPPEVQFSPVYAFASVDVDKDGDNDVVTGGNESKVRVRLGNSDAHRGLVFLNDGKGNFSYLPQGRSGLNVEGDVRSIIRVGDELIFGINDSKIKTFKLKEN